MRILFLTQYFPPEVGAPQNRLYELAVRLIKMGVEVEVLTAMPNYPAMKIHSGYRRKIFCTEEMNGLKVFRSHIFVSRKKNVVFRLLNYFSFVFSSFFYGLFKLRKYDFIFCESPPLFLGISAYLLCKFKHARMIFNVSDLWPESAEKLGIITSKPLLKAATKLEEFLYWQAVLITGQTQGIVADIARRFPDKPVYWLPNGVDISYYNPDSYDKSWRLENGFEADQIILAYAGILGYAQGLEVIIKAAGLLKDRTDLKFILLGSGPEKEKLIAMNKKLSNDNVVFLDVITKVQMPHFVSAIDASIIPLKNLSLFEGAIPSKIFENLAMKKPILLGLKGEAKELFIIEGQAGIAFKPEDEHALKDAILALVQNREQMKQFGENGRNYVEQNFNRNKLAESFYQELTQLM